MVVQMGMQASMHHLCRGHTRRMRTIGTLLMEHGLEAPHHPLPHIHPMCHLPYHTSPSLTIHQTPLSRAKHAAQGHLQQKMLSSKKRRISCAYSLRYVSTHDLSCSAMCERLRTLGRRDGCCTLECFLAVYMVALC